MGDVSVVVPNYNNAKWIPACIESCLAQGEDHLHEIIVVDDQSLDDSWSVLQNWQKQYPDILKVYRNPEKGGNQARRFGFEQATGDFVQWLDSDDVILPAKFEKQLACFRDKPQVDVVYSDWRYDFYEAGMFHHSEARQAEAHDDYLLELVRDNWLPCHSYLMRKSLADKLHQIKAWNPETRVAQDREYFTLAAIYGRQFAYVPGQFAVYNRWSLTSVSKLNFKTRLELNAELIYRYKKEIALQETMSSHLKGLYTSYLDTELLVSCYYHPRLPLQEIIPLRSIRLKRIHWKMRFVIPIVYLWSVFLLWYRKVAN